MMNQPPTAAPQPRIFPLHLSDIERFLLADDRPSHPMTFVIELDFIGQVEVQAFKSAVEASLLRHPLLASKLGPAKNRAHCWLPPDGSLPSIDVGDLDAPISIPTGEWIDLEQEVGLRVWLRFDETQSTITMQFHHACCDGIGAYRFIGDVLAYYGNQINSRTGDQPTDIPPIDLRRLRGRADRCRLIGHDDRSWAAAWDSSKYAWGIVGRSSTPLAINGVRPQKKNAPFPGVRSYTFSQSETNQLRDSSKELGLMLNDLLLLELFETTHLWNTLTSGRSRNGYYRVMMPVDLRSTDDFETPAANVIGYTMLSRRGSELSNRSQLASGIREETSNIKCHRLGERFNHMIARASGVRGLLPLVLRLPRTLSTVVLSNVGDPSRRFLAKFKRVDGCVACGNLVLRQITGAPPLRPKSRASFSVVSYRRQLTLSLRCDPTLYSLVDTDTLLDLYITQLRVHLSSNLQPEIPVVIKETEKVA